MGDAMGEDARLSRARAGDHEQRPFGCENRLALGLVEDGEVGLRLGDGHRPMLAAAAGHPAKPSARVAALEHSLPRISRRRVLAEAREHLRDSVATHQRGRARSSRDAEAAAVADFGPVEIVAPARPKSGSPRYPYLDTRRARRSRSSSSRSSRSRELAPRPVESALRCAGRVRAVSTPSGIERKILASSGAPLQRQRFSPQHRGRPSSRRRARASLPPTARGSRRSRRVGMARGVLERVRHFDNDPPLGPLGPVGGNALGHLGIAGLAHCDHRHRGPARSRELDRESRLSAAGASE